MPRRVTAVPLSVWDTPTGARTTTSDSAWSRTDIVVVVVVVIVIVIVIAHSESITITVAEFAPKDTMPSA